MGELVRIYGEGVGSPKGVENVGARVGTVITDIAELDTQEDLETFFRNRIASAYNVSPSFLTSDVLFFIEFMLEGKSLGYFRQANSLDRTKYPELVVGDLYLYDNFYKKEFFERLARVEGQLTGQRMAQRVVKRLLEPPKKQMDYIEADGIED